MQKLSTYPHKMAHLSTICNLFLFLFHAKNYETSTPKVDNSQIFTQKGYCFKTKLA